MRQNQEVHVFLNIGFDFKFLKTDPDLFEWFYMSGMAIICRYLSARKHSIHICNLMSNPCKATAFLSLLVFQYDSAWNQDIVMEIREFS